MSSNGDAYYKNGNGHTHENSESNGLNGYGKDGETFFSIGANPPPAWSHHIGPEHTAPPPVATQLVVPTNLSDGPVDLTCVHCQHHVTTRVKTGPSILSWGLCICMLLCPPLCCIPFCCNRLNVTEHRCSNCDRLLGKYKGWKGKADP